MLLKSFEWFHHGDKSSWLFRSFEPSNLINMSKNLDILIAIDDESPGAEKIIGYISSSSSLFGAAYIPTVAVDPAYQRRGLGQKIVEAKLKILKSQGMRKAWLLVTSTNTRAIEFYLKNSFVIEGFLRDHTGPGRDEIVFSKFL